MNKETNSEKISYGLGFFIIPLFVLLLRSRSRITRSKQQKTVQLVSGVNTVLDVSFNVFLDDLSNFRGNKYWQLFCSSVKCISNRRAELYWALHKLYALWKTGGVCVCWCLFFFSCLDILLVGWFFYAYGYWRDLIAHTYL